MAGYDFNNDPNSPIKTWTTANGSTMSGFRQQGGGGGGGAGPGNMPSWLQPLLNGGGGGGGGFNYGAASRFGPVANNWNGGANGPAQQALDMDLQKRTAESAAIAARGGYQGGAVPTAQQVAGPNRGKTKFDMGFQNSLQSAYNAPQPYGNVGGGGGGAGGRGGAGGMGGGGPQGGIANEAMQMMQEANAANEQRYQQLLGLAGQKSNAAQDRETRLRNQQLGQAQQQLQSRGLGNSTIVQGVERGIYDDSGLRQQQIGDQGINDAMGIVERRNDTGPDLAMIASLASHAGASGQVQAGPGGGGYVGGGGGGGGGGAMAMMGPTAVSPQRRPGGLFGAFGQSLAGANAADNRRAAQQPNGNAITYSGNWGPTAAQQLTTSYPGYETGDLSSGAFADYYDPRYAY